MIRVIKGGYRQVNQKTYADDYNTRDFRCPELEKHILNKDTGEFIGIEIIEDKLTTAEEK